MVFFLSTRLSKNMAHVSEQLRCYSVVRPIMRASHARDWGSNPHSSTLTLMVLFSFAFDEFFSFFIRIIHEGRLKISVMLFGYNTKITPKNKNTKLICN